MCPFGLLSPVSLAINSNKDSNTKFLYIYNSVEDMEHKSLKHFWIYFHLAD